MKDHAKQAGDLFQEGYNCAQSVFCAFCEETDLPVGEAARIASSFGGGMGRLREVCGAVSGALLVLGMKKGYSAPGDDEAKREHYLRVQEFARAFREKNGTIICRELLEGVEVSPGDIPEKRTKEFYERRPCLRLIRDAAQIAEEMLMEERDSNVDR